jgi:hypothetical protein
MKKQLLMGLMIAGMGAVAQTPRLSLYEEFTGETCGPCAATNPGLNTLLSSPTNTTKIAAIKWQVPIPSAPTPTWSLYKTNQAEIDWRWQSAANGGYGYSPAVTYAPFGKIDGQSQAVFGATGANVDHPANLTNGIIATAQSYTSAFSITMNRAWDNTYSSINLTVNIVASANFTATGALIFRTVMVEKEIHFATQPGTNGEKDFYDVAIKSFPTLQGGTAMASTWIVGQTQTFTLNCPIPAYARDKSQIAFVGFIQDDGTQKVAQVGRAATLPLANDAKAVSITIPALTCSNSAVPQITVKNNGTNAITGFGVTPYVNGVAGTVFNWTGNLAVGASTTFPLNAINVVSGSNTFSFNISSVIGTDNNLANNGASTSFIGVINYQATPVAEGFVAATFPPTNWSTYNNYAGTTWIRVTTAGIAPTAGNSTKLDFYTGVPDQSVNELVLPPVSFTSAPIISFDVAYSQYTTADNDKLEVLVSNDCGANWTTVYSKSGAALETVGAVTSAAFVPTASQWRNEVAPFPVGFTNNLLVKFVGTSDYGNNLYLDNINLKQCTPQTIAVSSTKTVICKGESTTISATGATSINWSNNATGASIVVSPTITTTYTATSADLTGCGNKSAFTVTVSTCQGIAANGINIGSVNLFPNPTSGVTNLTIELVQNETVSISVLNSVGQEVYVSNANNLTAGLNTLLLNTENWANGVYFIKVSSGNGFVNQKLTVSK